MDAIDTNVLIRYLVQDHPRQGKKAKTFIDKGDPKFISHIVIIEAFWVLASSYGLKAKDIVNALLMVVESARFVVEKPSVVRESLMACIDGFDFADMLIAHCGDAADCNATYTFDRRASKHVLFELLAG